MALLRVVSALAILWPCYRRCTAADVQSAGCTITVDSEAVSHRISNLTMGCHSDTGYAHQSRGLSAEMVYGAAFEQVPDAPFVPAVGKDYPCKWIGRYVGFNTHGGGPGDVEIATTDAHGRPLTEEAMDAACCARCDCAHGCEFWERNKGSNGCSLRAAFAGFDNTTTTARGNFKNASSGKCYLSDPVVASGSGWLGFGGALLDSSTSPVPRGLWAPPSRSLLLGASGAGATNRGFAGEGFHLKQGKVYEGYLVLKSASAVKIAVSLEQHGGAGAVFARTIVSFAGGNWTQVHFKLTPSEGTECEGLSTTAAHAAGISCPENNTYVSMTGGWGRASAAPGGMSDMTAHICVKCGGQLTIAKSAGGPVSVGYVSLQPGPWGRYKGTSARLEAVQALQHMGVKLIRSGGSVACDPTMAWTAWRGPVWQRPSASSQGNWVHSLVSGWGPFEAMELCDAMDDGVTCVITLFGGMTGETGHAAKRCAAMEHPPNQDQFGDRACDLSSQAYGDLVEYVKGDHTTVWGRQRIEDGHASPYGVTHFELGNEQYNANFASQVKAMEARAKALKLPQHSFSYLWPQGPGDSPGRKDFAPNAADAQAINALGLGSQILSDIHGPSMGGVAKAEEVFAEPATSGWGAMNLETNCGDHTMHRALTEGRDLNLFFRFPNPALKGRAASFCMERSGYNEGFANDQGLVFFLPNMTWLQPPGHVHAMISQSWQPLAVNFSLSSGCPTSLNVSAGDVSVSASEDGLSASVRIVNDAAVELHVSVAMTPSRVSDPLAAATGTAVASVLQGSACAQNASFPYVSEHTACANTPAQPYLFAPTSWERVAAGGLRVPSYSYAIVKVERG